MISFKDFLGTFKKKFICLKFTPETNRKLMEYALDNGFNLTTSYDGSQQPASDFDFHITIFYTSSTHNTSENNIKIEPFKIKLTKPMLLGKEKNIPVLGVRITSDIRKIRNLFEQQGYRDMWPTYKPHISLSYERKLYNLDGLKLPDFDIIAEELEIKNQSA